MHLDPTFKFAPETALAPRSAAVTTPSNAAAEAAVAAPVVGLGPLAVLLNDGKAAATWEGTGFNMMWRPRFDPTGVSDHFLELNLTNEFVTFSPIAGAIPNRGLLQEFIKMYGINYLDHISDAVVKDETGQPAGLQFEPEIWAIVPATTNPLKPQTVVRMASIPHGTAIVAQGTIDCAPIAGRPQIGITSI